jgi:3-isopropylmalate dehydrogenase
MDKTIAVLAGDGIGPEIIAESLKVLNHIAALFGHHFTYVQALIGGAAWEEFRTHCPEETFEICSASDAILFGSVGGPIGCQSSPKWHDCEKNSILALRKRFGLSCNIRPIQSCTPTAINLICMRELSEDIYFGEHETYLERGQKVAHDVMFYHESTIRSIAHLAFQFAELRRKKITSVDKANVLDCSRLWREVVTEVSKEYPACTLEHMLVDNCAMQLMKNPSAFDVLLMPNLFGDILSDLASVLVGSLGLLPSASLNQDGFGLYEPAGGSAQDIAEKGIANPIGQILSAALLLKHSFKMHAEHEAIVAGVKEAISSGYFTQDISPNRCCCSTSEMGDAIINFIKKTENYMKNKSSIMDFCFFRNKVVKKTEAQVSLACHSLQYGSTCFAGIRGYLRDGTVRIFRLRDHHERLMNASKILGFGFRISFEEFEQIIHALIQANQPTCDFYIRPFLFSETEVIGVCYDQLPFDLGIYMLPLNNYYQSDKGLKLMVSSWQKVSDASISTKAKAGGFYLNSALATSEARRCGYDEALMMDHNQNIVEASVANLFVVYRGVVFTPPLGSDLLEGITRRTIIELLEEHGHTIHYETISRSMLYTCDELFLTGTAAQVIFGESVDGRVIGTGMEGPLSTQVKQWFQDLIEMRHPMSKKYIKEFIK